MRFLPRARWIVALYLLLAVAVSIHKYMLPAHLVDGTGIQATQYNNYVIFERSGSHLLAGADLYRTYPDEHWDLFKYSPTFALGAVPLTWLPDWLGLSLWNAANALVLLAGILMLPLDERPKAIVALLVLKELMTSMQNSQSNGLVAGLILLTVVALERDRAGWAGLCLAASFYLKIYGAAAGILVLMYPCRWRASAWSALWFVVLGALPLAVATPDELWTQYQGWLAILASDHRLDYGLSVMGVANSWLGLSGIEGWLMPLGIAGLLAPLARVRQYGDLQFRLGMLASLLVWLVVFNHKAESPTYVVAVTGLAIWYVSAPSSRWDSALLAAAFLLTSWTSGDVVPRWIRTNLLVPYRVKAIGSIVVWPRMALQLLTRKADEAEPEIYQIDDWREQKIARAA